MSVKFLREAISRQLLTSAKIWQSTSSASTKFFRPGGKKIISMVADYVGKFGKDVCDSLWVLQNHGNMSSSTILHILQRFMQKQIAAGEKGYMLAFGPGFMAQSLLLEWR